MLLAMLFSRSILAILIWLVGPARCLDLDHYLDPFDSHPRLLIKNGHLVLLTGRNKDLIFRSSGSGQIKINGNDVLASRISSLGGSAAPASDLVPVGGGGGGTSALVERKMTALETRLTERLDQLAVRLNDTVANQRKMFGSKHIRRVRLLLKRMDRLEKLLRRNECDSGPCQNGGSCEDGFDQYICRCVAGFQGANCEQDVDECRLYQGTELGCQNGGTCLNTLGGFHCLCPASHQGVRCTIEFNDCRNASDHELCGHGLCLNLPRTQTNVARFRCVCYQGFAKSATAIADPQAPCDVDVDECAIGVDHCSRQPPVTCINMPDGYRCGPCPPGYTGDGRRCRPLDRCMVANGGCSQSPHVPCFTLDDHRVVCGPCPAGYIGDGTVCSPVSSDDICAANNGGCAPQAVCLPEVVGHQLRRCRCPAGYTGSGVGARGCQPVVQHHQSCATEPCQNGAQCYELHGSAYCACPEGFTGAVCETPISVCRTGNPCANGGQCLTNSDNHYYCVCTAEYMGLHCEQPRSSCGGQLDAEAGVLAYPATTRNGTRADGIMEHLCTHYLMQNV